MAYIHQPLDLLHQLLEQPHGAPDAWLQLRRSMITWSSGWGGFGVQVPGQLAEAEALLVLVEVKVE